MRVVIIMMSLFKGLYMAFGMFSTIPLPRFWKDAGAKQVMLFLPLVGAVIGLVWWIAAYVLAFHFWRWVANALAAGFLMPVPVILSGLIHLDGFIDTCDAVLSRRSIEDKMRILKDTNTGAFAVIMVIFLFVIQFAALYSLMASPMHPRAFVGVSRYASVSYFSLFLVIPVLSRCGSALAMICIKPLTDDGYASLFRPRIKVPYVLLIALVAVVAFLFSWAFAGYRGVIVAGVVVLGYAVSMLSALEGFDFKGISGDFAGFSLVISEVCGLVALAILASRAWWH